MCFFFCSCDEMEERHKEGMSPSSFCVSRETVSKQRHEIKVLKEKNERLERELKQNKQKLADSLDEMESFQSMVER